MNWTQGLNPEQAQAVLHTQGPLLILAGAGSGKTTVLVARTGRLIADRCVLPEQACVLTFTNKAARELKIRVAHRLGSSAEGLWAGTFHSFGLRLLRRYHREARLSSNFGVIDASDSQSLLRELLKDMRMAGKDKFDLERLLELINNRRAKGKFTNIEQDEYLQMAELLFPKFVKKMEVMGVVDFEGLLLKPLELFQEHPEILVRVQEQYQQVMVDEFQDTNALQMKLIDHMAHQHRNITVVGDDDQSIYGWRGAEVRNILDFPKNYKPCQVIRLERNYRCTPAILDLANEVIKKNKHRHGKILRAEKTPSIEKPEIFIQQNEEDEADFLTREVQKFHSAGYDYKDIAILYRSNTQSGLIESTFRSHQIPHSVSGGTAFFDRKEVKDALAYLRFACQANDVSLRRIINTPPRGIGDTSLEKLNDFSLRNKCSFVKACRQWREAGLPEKTGEVIAKLLDDLQSLPQTLMTPPSAGDRLTQFLRSIGYRDHLRQTSSTTEAGDKRWLLIEILGRILDGFVNKGGFTGKTLAEFVDAMELRDDPDDKKEQNQVSLMTLHACKGLEFPIVILIGVEEDLLPHRVLGSDVDEERRLFYVGLTRAKERLILTRCQRRKRHGTERPVSPSRFLLEIPAELIHSFNGARPVSGAERESLLSNFMSQLDGKIQSSQGPKAPR